uniref:Uncharacterized protein n=1 Tax=Meloidogyne enterolobii TaxID=390850 RepID=A0A6V7XIF7_MELEN|nr:unnamed protein product [Meloidogyne enterolobii]
MIIDQNFYYFQVPRPSTRAIMDIKIGTRTFLESEVANKHKRVDLYKKMIELAPNEPTDQEDKTKQLQN